MAGLYDKAELLTALWRLGTVGDDKIPTSHGILDRVLQDCFNELPADLRNDLSFGVTSVGLRCYELPSILLAAQEAEFTTEPNPTYRSSIINFDEEIARQAVVARGLSTKEARRIGSMLRARASSLSHGKGVSSDSSTAA